MADALTKIAETERLRLALAKERYEHAQTRAALARLQVEQAKALFHEAVGEVRANHGLKLEDAVNVDTGEIKRSG